MLQNNCTSGNVVVLFQDEPECHSNQLLEYSFRTMKSTFSYGVNLDYQSQGSIPDYLYNAGGLSINFFHRSSNLLT